MLEFLMFLLVVLLIFVLSAIPLYLAVRMLHGKTTFWKTVVVNLIGGLIVSLANLAFSLFGAIIGFILLILLFKYAFKVGILRALLIWVVEVVFVILLGALAALLGVGIIASALLI